MTAVGIIANPASGKDIRRLVAYGTVIDNEEKINIVKRLVLGALSTEIDEIMIMPDTYGIGEKVKYRLGKRQELKDQLDRLQILPMHIRGDLRDTMDAVDYMKQRGVQCIITLGGDGTNRAVAKKCTDIPLIPVSTGTNNVFPDFMEGTTAGICAGYIAVKGLDHESINKNLRPTKRIDLWKNGEFTDIALVDAVVTKSRFIGSRAIWDMDNISQIVTTMGKSTNIGFSSIGGYACPVFEHESRGIYCKTGKKLCVKAPIAPGVVSEIGLDQVCRIDMDEVITIEDKPSVVALDGEREVVLKSQDTASLQLTWNGPYVADINTILGEASNQSVFMRKEE